MSQKMGHSVIVCFRGIMLKDLFALELPYVDTQTLRSILHDSRKPRAIISRLVRQGELIRLKNGFYLIRSKIEKSRIPVEQIANIFYGPSYVSLEYAMAFYGMIPEGVFTCTSVTLNKVKHFYNDIQNLSYYHLSPDRYEVGISHKRNEYGGYMIATPEKALADHVFRLCQGLNKKELFIDLTESKRIELSTLQNLDKILMQQIANSYHSKIIKILSEVLIEL